MNIDTTHGHPIYYAELQRIAEIHAKKNQDYGGGDPLGNFMESQAVGIPPWLGGFIRLQDKYKRACNLIRKDCSGAVEDESIEDTLRDLANYSLLVLALMSEQKDESNG